MEAPEVPHIEHELEQEAPEPEEHLAVDGPPPPPQDYQPQRAGYMAPGPSYLTAAQEVPFAPVYPGYMPGGPTGEYQGGQVGMPRMGNQGLKPPKWNEEKQALAKWLQEIIMHFKTTLAPRQQWGWIALHTLDEAVKHSLLAQLGHIWGVALDAEILSHPDFQISWEQFKYGMETLYGHKCTDFEIRLQIIAFTRPGSLGQDTIKYMQLLEQMFLKCENDIDDFSKLHALFTGLRPDLKCKCLLDRNDNHWSTYAGLRAHLHKVAPTYDQDFKSYGPRFYGNGGARNGRQNGAAANLRTVVKFHALRTDNRGKPVIHDRPQFKKPVGNRFVHSSDQRSRRRERGRSQGAYVPDEAICNPMEGQYVTRGDQVLETTTEILRCGGRCFRCFKPWSARAQRAVREERPYANNASE